MKEYNIRRRDMIRISSLAALSNMLAPALVSASVSAAKMNGFHEEKTDPENVVSPEGEICFMSAVTMASLLRSKKISAREVMQAHLEQIKKVNKKVNAIITFVPEDELMAQALAADESLAKGNLTGSLHGMPMAVKDLTETKGIRTTYGSPIWRNNIPLQDALLVQRQKQAGAIIIGKTNVPELGMGSQTFNPLFGPSYNPYDVTKTCGGSTGGGAAALACGMIPLADGSDMGGSLRNPGNFC
ncbi:MAG TPA: amidase family protein, partial [Puia sp.]|nr:amidase family protein [Puia sp.]